MKVEEVTCILNISTRQIIRIKGRVSIFGPGAIIHSNRNRKPVNAVGAIVKDLVVTLKKNKYSRLNFSHFAEVLCENDNISIF